MSTLSIAPAFTPSRPTAARRRSSVRLTRRGRVVVFLAGLLAVLALAFVFAGGAVGTSEKGEPPATEIITVAPGDTLWAIASDLNAGGDVRDVMDEIRDLNALESVALTAGQKLRVPAGQE